MSIATEITRIQNAETAIKTSITNKGVTVPAGTKIDGCPALIDSIAAGGGSLKSVKLTKASNYTFDVSNYVNGGSFLLYLAAPKSLTDLNYYKFIAYYDGTGMRVGAPIEWNSYSSGMEYIIGGGGNSRNNIGMMQSEPAFTYENGIVAMDNRATKGIGTYAILFYVG